MLSAAMQASGDQPVLPIFYTLSIDLPASPTLPAHNLRLLDGAGVMVIDGVTYVGQDGDYGSWRGCEAIEETVATQAPVFSITLAALSDAAQQQIAQPISQGAPVTLAYGIYDQTTGRPVSDPEVIFYGALDVAHIKLGRNTRTLTLDVIAATELMFLNDDGSKLNSSWHNQFFPAELGFAFVDSVIHNVPWGGKGPRPDQASLFRNYDTDRGGGRTTLNFG